MAQSQSQYKSEHYWAQLRAALTAGQWESSAPATAVKGTTLSWADLVRKFKKHCSGDADVASAAAGTRDLSLLLARDGMLDPRALDGDDDASWDYGELSLRHECLLKEERVQEASRSYADLQRILENSNNDSVKLACAYYAYALGQYDECLAYLINTSYPETLAPIPESANQQPMRASADGISSLFKIHLHHHRPPPVTLKDDRTSFITESLRAFCLEGMAYEMLPESSPELALSKYFKGITLLSSFAVTKSLPHRTGKQNLESFLKHRELWRWTERLLWRSVVLAAQTSSIESSLILFRVYRMHSDHWPATFRPAHRSVVATLYLRALIKFADALTQRVRFQNQPHMQNGNTRSSGSTTSLLGQIHWMMEARSVINEYRDILSATTKFPKAGKRNVAVEEFVDLCVAVWESDGAVGDNAGWVIDILWWATRLTFNSPRILRHMTRLLHVSGDNSLAKRTLRLYVQVSNKARETESADGGLPFEEHVDSDNVFVMTLVQGVRMLCRVPGDVDDVRQAGKLIEVARRWLNTEDLVLAASVDLAEGIYQSILTQREQDPATRLSLLSSSLRHFERSIEFHPTPSAYFHTALALLRPTTDRDIPRAIMYATKAVEMNGKELRYWHLLALLTAKAGEWKKAKGVLELADGIAEDMEARLRRASGGGGDSIDDVGSSSGLGSSTGAGTDAETAVNGTMPAVRDFANGSINASLSVNMSLKSVETAETVEMIASFAAEKVGLTETLISPSTKSLPSASSLLKPLPAHPPPSKRELFEHALQLKITELALTELVAGADGAEMKWLEVFEWYAERRDTTNAAPSTRPSTDGQLSVTHEGQSAGMSMTEKSSVDLNSQRLTNSEERPTDPTPPTSAPTMIIREIAPTPDLEDEKVDRRKRSSLSPDFERERDRSREKEKDRDKDTSKGRKVQKMLKEGVHKGQARITTISKKIGSGVARGSGGLGRSKSTPDFHAVLTRGGPYQASSIHSRKRVISWGSKSQQRGRGVSSPVPSLPPPVPPPLPSLIDLQNNQRATPRERRLLSELWLTSAAMFRRSGKIDQARGAIQEAEVLDEENEAVWVQLGLYFSALGNEDKAVQAFHKALFISQDDCAATIHLCRLYLSQDPSRPTSKGSIDMAAGLLEQLTHGPGWDIAEAWYLLAKAFGLQGRKTRERECLVFALGLAETRGVRDIGAAIGWCI